MFNLESGFSRLLQPAGISINGSNPWDVAVHNPKLYMRVLKKGTLGLGEAYMDGWWDAPQLDEVFARVLKTDVAKTFDRFAPLALATKALFFNLQSRARAAQVAEVHYDLGNDLYQAMLDPLMIYTCAYWSSPSQPRTLAEAQIAKLDLVCRKLGLKEGDRVLDIGCGWGGFATFAAEHYGASVVGITVSKEQLMLAEERCKGLPVKFRLQDYREVNDTFDHIVSIEMFEAVGYKNFRRYFEIARRCLREGGLFLLQTIGTNESTRHTEPWFDKYIFPNGMLPSLTQISAATEGLFGIEDVHNFGFDYDRTLMAWYDNFHAAWPTLRMKFPTEGEAGRFYRKWTYYLLSCAGAFRARFNQDWQIVLSPKGVPGGYVSVR